MPVPTLALFALQGAIAFAKAAVVAFAVQQISARLFAPKQPRFKQDIRRRSLMVRSATEPMKGVYGEAMVSGPLLFAETTEDDRVLHLVIGLAGHECESIGTLFFNDSDENDTRFRENRRMGYTGLSFTNASGQVVRINNAGDWFWENEFGPGDAVMVENAGASYDGLYIIGNSPNENDIEDHWMDCIRVTGGVAVNGSPSSADVYKQFHHIFRHDGNTAGNPFGSALNGVGGWTTNHTLKGVAAVYCVLVNDSKFGVWATGLPNIKAVVKGKKVFDPRTSTTSWSDNWALCVRDYISDPEYGINATAAELDDSAFITAADVADEQVNRPGGGTQNRYTCNGVVDLGTQPIDNLQDLLTAGAGVLVWINGKYRLHAGEFTLGSPITISEDDLRGPMTVSANQARKELFNAVAGTFADKSQNHIVTDYPVYKNATYATEDGGELVQTLDLPFTTDEFEAQRLAKLLLERSRQDITVEMPCKANLLDVAVWDLVYVDNTKLGWANKVFRVMDFQLSAEGGVDLVLREDASAIYDWDTLDATTRDPAPNTSLPSPWDVPEPSNLTLTTGDSELLVDGDGTTVSRVKVEWSMPVASFRGKYEIEYRLYNQNPQDPWQHVAFTTMGPIWIAGVSPAQEYEVRIRAISDLSIASDWVATNTTVVGKTTAPAAPFNLSASTTKFRAIEIQWTNPGNVDYAYTEIWRSTTNDRATANLRATMNSDRWSDLNNSAGFTAYYWIRNVDRSGNVSAWHPISATSGVQGQSAFLDSGDLPDDLVLAQHLADGSVDLSTAVVVGEVDAAKIAADAVGASELAANAVAAINIQTNAVTETKILDDAISTPKLQANAVTADEIAANAVTAVKILVGAISAVKIAAGAVIAGKIAADAVEAGNIAANAVEAGNIAANAIASNEIAANTISAAMMQANSITAGNAAIAALAVLEANIGNGAVTNLKIGDIIQSGTFTATQGWQLDKNGNITASSILIRDSVTGATLLSSGDVPADIRNENQLWADIQNREGNLIDLSGWTQQAGAMPPTGWTPYGVAARNSFALVGTPKRSAGAVINEWGTAWICDGVNSQTQGGGFNGSNTFVVDSQKAYRFIVFVYKVGGQTFRKFFMGPNILTNAIENIVTGAVDNNPYFFFNFTLANLNRWYMAVGYIHQDSHSSTTMIGALYDMTTGLGVASPTNEFRWRSGANGLDSSMRSLQFGSLLTGGSGEDMHLWGPRVDVIDGNEPSVEELMAAAHKNLSPREQITSSNASTYIANLAVDTLQIAGDAVTIGNANQLTSDLTLLSGVSSVGWTNTSFSLTVDATDVGRFYSHLGMLRVAYDNTGASWNGTISFRLELDGNGTDKFSGSFTRTVALSGVQQVYEEPQLVMAPTNNHTGTVTIRLEVTATRTGGTGNLTVTALANSTLYAVGAKK